MWTSSIILILASVRLQNILLAIGAHLELLIADILVEGPLQISMTP